MDREVGNKVREVDDEGWTGCGEMCQRHSSSSQQRFTELQLCVMIWEIQR